MGGRIFYAGKFYDLENGETVLDGLSRRGLDLPHSCKSGICQSCLMQAVSGAIPEAAQTGLTSGYKKQNLFLACQCRPAEDMDIRLPGEAGLDVPVSIQSMEMLNHNVMRLVLKAAEEFSCEPGQYLSLINGQGVARSYSVANDPGKDGYIALHIRFIKDGKMSGWLENEAELGNALNIRGPAGNCFYTKEDSDDYPLVLAGTGTGLAPLFGILNRALEGRHKGDIHLYHGALRREDLYYVDELRALSERHDRFHYTPCVLNGREGTFYKAGNIEDIVMSALPENKSQTRLFLCGAPEMVNSLKKKAFLSGLASKHIFADAFLPSKA
jgi:NAD(P)H-flavin reductase